MSDNRVKTSYGFVEHKQLLGSAKRAGEQHSLLLTARKLPVAPAGKIGYAEALHIRGGKFTLSFCIERMKSR